MYCERCQIEYPEGRKFCRQCGELLKPKATVSPGKAAQCPSCGAPISLGIKFCGKCGTSLVGRKTYPSGPERTSALGTTGQVEEEVLLLEKEVRQRRQKVLKGMAAGIGGVGLLAIVISKLQKEF